jgi:hypothetical protein
MPMRGKNKLDEKLDRQPKAGKAAQRDAKGQFAATHADPNAGGLVSANPVVLSGSGDATQGEGHGRDRDTKGSKSG